MAGRHRDAGTGWHERKRPRRLVGAAGVVIVIVVAVVVSVLLVNGGHSKKAKPRALVAVRATPIPTVAPFNRIEVVLDAPNVAVTQAAQTRLTDASLTLVKALPDVPFGQFPSSRVLVFDSSARSQALAHKAATALGIPNAPVLVTDQSTVVTDAIVVLSKDYKP
jgi:hypothetical protein